MFRCPFNKENGFTKEGRGFSSSSKEPHYGTDHPAPAGTPVPAVLDGVVVVNTFNRGGYGNVVILKHEISRNLIIYTLYAHLEDNSSTSLPPGTRVKRNSIIGKVGNTGTSTGAHLHFEVILRSKLPYDICPTPDGSLGIPKGTGRIDPKKLACNLRIVKIIDYIWTIELSGIDTGEKCMGDHHNPWAVGCIYGITLGQVVSGFWNASKNGNWSFDPCAVNCGIWKNTATITTREILIIDDIIIKTPGGFFSAKGTRFLISVSKDNLETNVFVMDGEIEYIKSRQKFQIDKITSGNNMRIIPPSSQPDNSLRRNMANDFSKQDKNLLSQFTTWAETLISFSDPVQILTSRISSLLTNNVIIEIPPGGAIYYCSAGTSPLSFSNKENAATKGEDEGVTLHTTTYSSCTGNICNSSPTGDPERNFSPPKEVIYNGLIWNISKIVLSAIFNNRRAPDGKLFLIVNVTLKNKSDREIFICYDEEVRLLLGKDKPEEIIPLENYWLPTDFEPGKESDGILLFIIHKGKSDLNLQLGRKNALLPEKVEVTLLESSS